MFIRNHRLNHDTDLQCTNTEMVEIKEIGLDPNSKFRTFHPRIYI